MWLAALYIWGIALGAVGIFVLGGWLCVIAGAVLVWWGYHGLRNLVIVARQMDDKG